MRTLTKLAKPDILEENEKQWLADYIADKTSETKKHKYRHQEIKTCLKKETGYKCVYCESKIGHNTPGDVEHKIPSSKNVNLHFDWFNLTIACTECNRRKNDYYEKGNEFLDPYTDDVESLVEHHGPIVIWKTNCTRAEITVRMLDLHSNKREQLISRKIEKIEELSNLLKLYIKEEDNILKGLYFKQLEEMQSNTAEYSGMVRTIIELKYTFSTTKTD